MVVAFSDSAGMTIMEIGMAMLLMRTGSAELDDFATEFARQFRVPVEADDLRPCYIRMLERGLIEPHPSAGTAGADDLDRRCGDLRRVQRLRPPP